MSGKFKLSTALFGHSLDVRAISVLADNSIVSGSRDKFAKFWRPNTLNKCYDEVMTYRDQQNFVIAILYLDPTKEYPDGLVITGGNDNTIYGYKPSEPFSSFTLKEHSNAVSCLSKGTAPNTFLSGSWDSTAKFWSLDKSKSSIATFSGHAAAVWAIIQLEDSRIVTGSADKTIVLWTHTGKKLATLTGHTDCVRGLANFPEMHQFVSVSNDASIRVWSYSGENIDTYYGHTNYIYSIARCKAYGDNCFVTSDEDRTVRFWQNGDNTQTFQLPAQSVWCVACLSNGDIVTGSSDGVIRIFTQEDARIADQETLTKFNTDVEALVKQSCQEIGGLKVSDLPGKEALYDPGKRAGQMKMIREGDKVVAYTWVEEGSTSHWDKVGDVLGSTDKDKNDKTMFEGKAYDFVFTVDVEDGKPPLKLPYNKGQDPYQAANEFLARNLLPSSYLEQVVDFILKNSKEQLPPLSTEYVDPFTGGSRYTPAAGGNNQGFTGANPDPFTGGNSYSTSLGRPPVPTNPNISSLDPFTGSSSYTTQGNNTSGGTFFPINTYRTFDMGDPNVVLGKLKEFNTKVGGSENCVDGKCLEDLIKICNGPPDDPNSFDVLFKLLDWPEEFVFPVLDVVRMAVRIEKNNEIIAMCNNGIIMQKLLNVINENCKTANNIIVALRTVCNLFTHEAGECLVFEHRLDLLENITALGPLHKSGQVALATFLLNLAVSVLRKNDELTISVLADVLTDILTKLSDSESQFRGYVALGTLLTASGAQQKKEVKLKATTNPRFTEMLQLHTFSSQNDLENKRKNCAKQLQNMLNKE